MALILASSMEKCDVFDEPIFDNSINSDEIRIPVHFQDLILDISESYIYIEGKFKPAEAPADGGGARSKCYLTNNVLAFFFEEIRYEMGGEQIAVARKPGITTAMKTMLSFDASQMPKTIHKGTHQCKTGIKNYYVGTWASVEIDKIEWKIRHVVPEDRLKLKLMSRINKSSMSTSGCIKVPYRMWDLYELPKLRETSSDIWAIKTSTSLETLIGNCDNTAKHASVFMTADVRDIRLYLNSDVYPYDRWNMDFTKKLFAPAYYAYINFQMNYYGKEISEPMLNFTQFLQMPVFVIDCSHQSEAVKSSTVDIKLEFETRKSTFPSNVKVYARILHDSLVKYGTLDGTVYLR
ncbi:hypothetical protein NQ315_000636 [Exocentrus adspersus]|uniref:Double jelly roll-like domain-containing protein n=1 Tax=Exocentrus adspersus TaxID=1586481 RepID=A0AAV8VNE2_9CUCU|nr:hypothetical protein NQ315_000636 [Exocentrus adspersus]